MVCQIFFHFFFQFWCIVLHQAPAHIVKCTKTAYMSACLQAVIGETPTVFLYFSLCTILINLIFQHLALKQHMLVNVNTRIDLCKLCIMAILLQRKHPDLKLRAHLPAPPVFNSNLVHHRIRHWDFLSKLMEIRKDPSLL